MDFTYTPLSTESHQIRLLCVQQPQHPNDNSGIHVTLQPVSYEDKPNYLALSYTWGPEQPTRTIFVDGARFTVRENLYHFLDRFRHDAKGMEGEAIWIDQICINQDDISERNNQVGRMRDVYSHASKVIVWLGKGSELGLAAVDLFRRTAELQKLDKSGVKMDEEDLEKMRAFLRNPYFMRLWIVQEIALAKKLVFWIGDGEELDWDMAFGVYTSQDKYIVPGRLNMIDDIHAFHRLHVQRTDPRGFKTFHSLEDHFYYFSRHQCADPRDRIFGLLGLFPNFAKSLPAVDYTVSIEDIYLTMSMVMISESPEREHTWNIMSGLGGQMGLGVGWLARKVREDELEYERRLESGEPVDDRNWEVGGSARVVGTREETFEEVKARLKRQWQPYNPR